MRRIAVALALLVVLAVPAQAAADIGFRGKSRQGKLVTLRTSDEGLVERFAIRWVGDCRDPRYVFRSGTETTPDSPFEVHTREQFVDVGGYRQRLRDGLRAVFRARTVGNRVSEDRWSGTFRIRAKVLRKSRLVDVCTARTRWRVVRQD
jgi:hypothetical protein